MSETDRAWIEVDREKLLHNVEELKRLSGTACELMPAVKANAYGHGDILISRILQTAGIDNFCVASADEAVRLREAGISGQILILGYTHPEEFPELVQYGLTQTVVDQEHARRLSQYAGRRKIRIHVGVDTGMHRLGIPHDRMDLIEEVWKLPGLDITGIFSHLCVSDGTTQAEEAYTREQIRRLRFVTEYLHRKGFRGFQSHIQGSYGLLNYPEYSFDLARPGIALYGVLSSAKDKVKTEACLSPVLALKARIACVKELPAGEAAGYGLTYTALSSRKTAIVTAGYADGIPRSLSNCGTALVGGRRVPVIGRVCMDQLTLDVTDVPGVSAGDEVVFIGHSCGKRAGGRDRQTPGSSTSGNPAMISDVITAEDMAEAAGTITNEILSRLGTRLGRIAV